MKVTMITQAELMARSEAMLTIIKSQFDMHQVVLEGDLPCVMVRIDRKNGAMKECPRNRQDRIGSQRTEKIAARFGYGPYEYTSSVGYFQAVFGLLNIGERLSDGSNGAIEETTEY